MKEKVSHNEVVRMVLIGVVALIKDQKVDLFHVHKSMSEQVIKLVGNHDQNILFEQLLAP